MQLKDQLHKNFENNQHKIITACITVFYEKIYNF